MVRTNPNQLELTPQPRITPDDDHDRYADLGIMNYYTTGARRDLGSQATAAATSLPPVQPAPPRAPSPPRRGGRNLDGTPDGRTLGHAGRRAADRPAPDYFPYK